MGDDFSVFWRNNEQAAAIFYDLLARSERDAYDDDFLAQLAAYRESGGNAVHADIFAARYCLANGDVENAIICGERALRLRSVNLAVWTVLAAAYREAGHLLSAWRMQSYAHGLYEAPLPTLMLPADELRDGLACLSIAKRANGYAPLLKQRAVIENGQLHFRPDLFIGEELSLTMPEGIRFCAGVYRQNEFLSNRSYTIEQIRHADWFTEYGSRDVIFDLQKAQEVHGEIHIHVPEGQEFLIPIAGTTPLQELTMTTPSLQPQLAYLGQWAFSYFRTQEDLTLHARKDAPYAVGTPIRLGHSCARKKLVLNILLDALPWNVARTRYPNCMPNIARFFEYGTIFDQHFSTSEYTYPSLTAIETGLYPQHTQIFNEKDSHELPLSMRTLAEQMSDLGYYCSAPTVGAEGIYVGTLRGYHRLVTTPWMLHAAPAVDRTIRHLEAFDETDQFLFLHITDVHPWNAMGLKFPEDVETHLPLTQRLFELEPSVASVRLPKLKIYEEHFWKSLAHVDHNLGMLLSYIETHFTEDDYIVNLYSDHGNAIFSPLLKGRGADIIAESSTRAAWMMRGAGVPAGRIVGELTSTTDLYPTLGALCGFPVADDIDGNLPAVFGGKERDVVYSMSMFPGQTFKLAVRTHAHAFRLETRELLDEDGTVDFADAHVGIYPRAHELEEDYAVDSEELRAFFCPRARRFVRAIANNGEFWPAMREARGET